MGDLQVDALAFKLRAGENRHDNRQNQQGEHSREIDKLGFHGCFP